jgi:hypothetical protein
MICIIIAESLWATRMVQIYSLVGLRQLFVRPRYSVNLFIASGDTNVAIPVVIDPNPSFL